MTLTKAMNTRPKLTTPHRQSSFEKTMSGVWVECKWTKILTYVLEKLWMEGKAFPLTGDPSMLPPPALILFTITELTGFNSVKVPPCVAGTMSLLLWFVDKITSGGHSNNGGGLSRGSYGSFLAGLYTRLRVECLCCSALEPLGPKLVSRCSCCREPGLFSNVSTCPRCCRWPVFPGTVSFPVNKRSTEHKQHQWHCWQNVD